MKIHIELPNGREYIIAQTAIPINVATEEDDDGPRLIEVAVYQAYNGELLSGGPEIATRYRSTPKQANQDVIEFVYKIVLGECDKWLSINELAREDVWDGRGF